MPYGALRQGAHAGILISSWLLLVFSNVSFFDDLFPGCLLTRAYLAICTVIDFTYVVLPIIIVWHLSLKPKIKLVLMGVLSFGLL